METEVTRSDVNPTVDAQLDTVSGMVGTPLGKVGGVKLVTSGCAALSAVTAEGQQGTPKAFIQNLVLDRVTVNGKSL